uniref:Uncharacterized protein n=1 Tax=Romanomermis culicivorax TaxID=13658 RepID=A0A915KSL8_ROMCU
MSEFSIGRFQTSNSELCCNYVFAHFVLHSRKMYGQSPSLLFSMGTLSTYLFIISSSNKGTDPGSDKVIVKRGVRYAKLLTGFALHQNFTILPGMVPQTYVVLSLSAQKGK